MKIFKTSMIAIACLGLSACGTYGTGEKVGQVIKLAQTGTICKTWEGEMIRGGFSSGSGVQGAPFDFTIEDPAILAKIQDALDGQYEIRLHYRTEFVTFCRSDSGGHFVTSVEVLNRAAPKDGAGGAVTAAASDVVKILIEQNEKLIALLNAK